MFKLESNSESLTWSLAALFISEGIQRAKANRKGITRETAIISKAPEFIFNCLLRCFRVSFALGKSGIARYTALKSSATYLHVQSIPVEASEQFRNICHWVQQPGSLILNRFKIPRIFLAL